MTPSDDLTRTDIDGDEDTVLTHPVQAGAQNARKGDELYEQKSALRRTTQRRQRTRRLFANSRR